MEAPTKPPGRAPATSHAQLSHIALKLFMQKGYDETTIDDIAAAAGIGRRTFFRYFASKHDLLWGDFDTLLTGLRETLDSADPSAPILQTIHAAVIEFNHVPPAELAFHRERMELLLHVPSLAAYSVLKYADWRAEIARFVGKRMGKGPDSLTAQTMSWACMGLCMGAYEKWLQDRQADLPSLFDEAFAGAQEIFGAGPDSLDRALKARPVVGDA